MRAVAKSGILRVFALAQVRSLTFGSLKNLRGKGRSPVRAIAERLLGRCSTATPGVGLSGFEFNRNRHLSGNLGLFHLMFVYVIDQG